MDEETEVKEEESLPEQIASKGIQASKKLIGTVVAFAVTAIVGSGAVVFWPSSPSPAVGVPTWTPVPSQIQPAPTDIHRPAVQVVEVQAQETESDRRIMDILGKLTIAVDNLAEEIHVTSGSQTTQPPAEQLPGGSDIDIPMKAEVPPTLPPAAQVSVWEDGSCWTPATATVLHLCGASESDGYVIRWVGVPGDNTGPEIADSDWHAVRGTGDKLVWAGSHPVTGDVVTIDYWSGGHVLAVRVAGRLLFRIDRRHEIVM